MSACKPHVCWVLCLVSLLNELVLLTPTTTVTMAAGQLPGPYQGCVLLQERMDRDAEPCSLQQLWAWQDPTSETMSVSCLAWNKVGPCASFDQLQAG